MRSSIAGRASVQSDRHSVAGASQKKMRSRGSSKESPQDKYDSIASSYDTTETASSHSDRRRPQSCLQVPGSEPLPLGRQDDSMSRNQTKESIDSAESSYCNDAALTRPSPTGSQETKSSLDGVPSSHVPPPLAPAPPQDATAPAASICPEVHLEVRLEPASQQVSQQGDRAKPVAPGESVLGAFLEQHGAPLNAEPRRSRSPAGYRGKTAIPDQGAGPRTHDHPSSSSGSSIPDRGAGPTPKSQPGSRQPSEEVRLPAQEVRPPPMPPAQEARPPPMPPPQETPPPAPPLHRPVKLNEPELGTDAAGAFQKG